MSRHRDATGQASVELIAILPLAALVVAVLWQAVLAGQAVWASAGAARAAARAQAIGGDALVAARGAVPSSLRAGVRVKAVGDGVRVAVAVPLVLTGASLGSIDSEAALPPQR
jgi:hypothetical protein